MSGSRYMAGMAYNPALRTATYGALRPGGGNALAPVYAGAPGVGFGMPGMPGGGGASLSGGMSGGALSGGAPMGVPMPPGGAGGDVGDNAASVGAMQEGNRSTGNVVDDARAVAETFGRFAGSLISNPMNIGTMALGGLVAGGLRAAGAKEAANAVMGQVFGFDASQGGTKGAASPGDIGAPPGGFGPQTGTKPDPLAGVIGDGTDAGGSRDEMGNPTDGSAPAGMTGDPSAAPTGPSDAMGNPVSDMGYGGGLGDSGMGGGSDGQAEGSPGSSEGGSKGGEGWRKGGYTGHGDDGMVDTYAVAGPVHEGEYVIRHEATRHYGPEIMAALNAGAIPRNALMAFVPQRRPMQAANHLVQMMMARG